MVAGQGCVLVGRPIVS